MKILSFDRNSISILLIGITSLIIIFLPGRPLFAQATNQPETDTSQVYRVVSEMPSFTEGSPIRWIAMHIRYPAVAMENHIQGRIIVEFIIEKDGSISNFKILKSAGEILDKEAKRLIKIMPKWNPGKQDGRPVRVAQSLPILFKLAPSIPLSSSSEANKSLFNALPTFPDGIDIEWVAKNIRYPEDAKQNGIEGQVFVRFCVEKDGSVTDVKITREPEAQIAPVWGTDEKFHQVKLKKTTDKNLENEAIRVVKSMPDWIPSKDKNARKVTHTIPVNFSIQ